VILVTYFRYNSLIFNYLFGQTIFFAGTRELSTISDRKWANDIMAHANGSGDITVYNSLIFDHLIPERSSHRKTSAQSASSNNCTNPRTCIGLVRTIAKTFSSFLTQSMAGGLNAIHVSSFK